jgi:hypothetical protein
MGPFHETSAVSSGIYEAVHKEFPQNCWQIWTPKLGLEWRVHQEYSHTSTLVLGKGMEEVSVSGAPGPEMFIPIMTIVYFGAGYDALEQCKTRLKSPTLKAIPGKNIIELSKEVTTLCEWLDDSMDMILSGDDLIANIFKIYEGSKEPHFM